MDFGYILLFIIGAFTFFVCYNVVLNRSETNALRKCTDLPSCRTGKDCNDTSVCYAGVCLSRKLCKAPPGIGTVGCDDTEICYTHGEYGYCVPSKIQS